MIPKPISCLLTLCASAALAGPNAGAVLAVDLAPATIAVDSTGTAAVDSAVWIVVRIDSAQGLAGYGFNLGYDTARLVFVQARPDSIPAGWVNFLTGPGGATAGFVGQIARHDSTQISIANTLTQADSAQAPNGGGLLALIEFQPKAAGAAHFTLSAIQLLDWRQQLDSLAGGSGATLNVQPSPVALWRPRSVFVSARGPKARYEIADLRNVLGRIVSLH